MGAEAGTSLLPNVALLAVGFLLGRVQLVPIAAQLVDEVGALSTARKVRRACVSCHSDAHSDLRRIDS